MLPRFVVEQLVATRAATPFELRHGTIPTYTNATDNSKLITFRRTDGGQTRYVCSCAPLATSARLATRVPTPCSTLRHAQAWKHWRLVAYGEAQPTEAAWAAFQATVPGWARSGRA